MSHPEIPAWVPWEIVPGAMSTEEWIAAHYKGRVQKNSSADKIEVHFGSDSEQRVSINRKNKEVCHAQY